jgi:predicted MFS family arabinose efflux permease
MFNIFRLYRNSFSGLRKEVWWLALVTFVNRAGTMVIPFLSLYLTASLGFTLKDVGWVLSAFGLGSVVGSWLGGKLTDRIGAYPVMLWSLLLSGILFIMIQYIESFWGFCAGIFTVMLVADTFRPALFVAINDYCLPENRTRSVSLIRLAINLGFSFGPAVGGLIIANVSYSGLFWIDGITCVMAALVFVAVLPRKERKVAEAEEAIQPNVKSPYRDKVYLLFVFILILIGFSFLQYFSTIPLYYRDYHHLTEEYVGWLMALNGFLVFVFEMPLIKYFEKPRFNMYYILFASTLLFALSFLVLNMMNWWGMLVIGMVFMSLAEILNFPFLNSFAMVRGQGKSLGAYMALFSIGFSISHIMGHNSGMQLIDQIGFDATWYVMIGCLVLAALLILVLKRMVEREG